MLRQLNTPVGARERDFFFAKCSRRQDHMGIVAAFRHEEVLDHQQVELPELAGNVTEQRGIGGVVARQP